MRGGLTRETGRQPLGMAAGIASCSLGGPGVVVGKFPVRRGKDPGVGACGLEEWTGTGL